MAALKAEQVDADRIRVTVEARPAGFLPSYTLLGYKLLLPATGQAIPLPDLAPGDRCQAEVAAAAGEIRLLRPTGFPVATLLPA